MGSEVRSRPHLVMFRAAGLASLSDALGLCASVELLSGWFQRCGGVLQCVVS